MEGGRGYTPQQVGELTIDQILMLLTDRKLLERNGIRSCTVSSLEAISSVADKYGNIKAVAENGATVVGKIGGKSKARLLMEAKATREASEKQRRPKRRRN